MQAACKIKRVKLKSVAEGSSSIVHVLFIPAAVAEGGILGVFMAVILWGKYPV